MTYAIVEAGGKQLRVEPGRFYDIDRLALEVDDSVALERVLFVDHDGEALVGQPVVEGATVTGSVVSHLRGRKIIVYKMQPKKKTRKKQGHRQELTRVMINSIEVGGKVIAGEAAAKEVPPAEVEAAEADADS
ncbi:MAG: 50S ribosomal protein L21 [Leptolyngbya sp.]|jgi:large subunit ribosomal protein L21|nr:MAG: 50S ribosomal protein L21 [Leptolyngbya sp.]